MMGKTVEEMKQARVTARWVLEDALDAADEAYEEATAPARKVYDEAKAAARKAYEEALKHCDEEGPE